MKNLRLIADAAPGGSDAQPVPAANATVDTPQASAPEVTPPPAPPAPAPTIPAAPTLPEPTEIEKAQMDTINMLKAELKTSKASTSAPTVDDIAEHFSDSAIKELVNEVPYEALKLLYTGADQIKQLVNQRWEIGK